MLCRRWREAGPKLRAAEGGRAVEEVVLDGGELEVVWRGGIKSTIMGAERARQCSGVYEGASYGREGQLPGGMEVKDRAEEKIPLLTPPTACGTCDHSRMRSSSLKRPNKTSFGVCKSKDEQVEGDKRREGGQTRAFRSPSSPSFPVACSINAGPRPPSRE